MPREEGEQRAGLVALSFVHRSVMEHESHRSPFMDAACNQRSEFGWRQANSFAMREPVDLDGKLGKSRHGQGCVPLHAR